MYKNDRQDKISQHRYDTNSKSMTIRSVPTYKLLNGVEIKLDSKAVMHCLDNLLKYHLSAEWQNFKFGHEVDKKYVLQIAISEKTQVYTPDGVSDDGKTPIVTA